MNIYTRHHLCFLTYYPGNVTTKDRWILGKLSFTIQYNNRGYTNNCATTRRYFLPIRSLVVFTMIISVLVIIGLIQDIITSVDVGENVVTTNPNSFTGWVALYSLLYINWNLKITATTHDRYTQVDYMSYRDLNVAVIDRSDCIIKISSVVCSGNGVGCVKLII